MDVKTKYHVPFMRMGERYGVAHDALGVSDKSNRVARDTAFAPLPLASRESSTCTFFFLFGPRGAGIRRLTGRQKIQGNQYQKERLIRHTSQSSHGSGDSGPKWLAHPRSVPL